MKILLAVMVSMVVVVVGVFGVRFVNSINFEPVTIEHSQNTEYSESINNSEVTIEEEQQNDEPNEEPKSLLQKLRSLSSIFPVIVSTVLVILGLRFFIHILKSSFYPF